MSTEQRGLGRATSEDASGAGTAAIEAPAFDVAPQFKILSERTVYKRYIRMLDRRVQYPDGRAFDYDVVSTAFFTLAVAFHTADQSFTLIEEYAQGPNNLVFAFAGGKWEPDKTEQLLDSARAELAEEAQLTGGRWVPLLPEGAPGIAEVKWSSNRFAPYLVVDPDELRDPPARDAEGALFSSEPAERLEYIRICRHVSVSQLRDYILAGRVMLPSVQAAILAVAHLRTHEGVAIPSEHWL